MRQTAHSAWFVLVVSVSIVSSGCDRDRAAPRRSRIVSPGAETLSSAITLRPATPWRARKLDVAPTRFRPHAWSSENDLWGLLGGRVTRLDVNTGEVRRLSATAWSIDAAPNVVSWRNETGTWMLRNGATVRLATTLPDLPSGFDGPPTVLWSPDGTRALLAWQGEWDARHALLETNGSIRPVKTRIPGYFLNSAALWLDSQRVLFQIVAMVSLSGDSSYRESGWRGNLAVLDLETGQYELVTGVRDFVRLRVVGLHHDEVLVTEWDRSGIRAHWFYDPRTWRGRPASLPRGRAHTCSGGVAIVLLDAQADNSDAVLIAAGDTTKLGKVAGDAQPACSPGGQRGVLRTGEGLLLFEAAPPVVTTGIDRR